MSVTDCWRADAMKASKIYRKHGIKCRVIVCKHYESYLAIYRDEDCDVDEHRKLLKKADAECFADELDFFNLNYVVEKSEVEGEVAS